MNRTLVAVAAIAVVALGVAGLVVATRDDGEPSPTTSSTPTTTAPVDTTTAVYPSADAAVHFDDPVDAARSFAVDYVGFVDPVLGEYQAGDSQSGEVEVRPSASGPVTTVLVRRLGTAWFVLGAATSNIELHEPSALGPISSPVRLRGVSAAFEANVSVEIRADGARRPIGEGYVMGGSMGEMGAFDGTVSFAEPSAPMGAIVLLTRSMEDGHVWEASVVRVGFRPVATLVPASDCPDYSMDRPEPATGQMVVTVFFTCGIDADPVPTYRLATDAPGVLQATLEALLTGPTGAEKDAGLQSWFSPDTAGMLSGVTIESGQAVVDFHDLPGVIPNASTSAGSRLLMSQLDATVFQFSSVESVIYRIEGDCAAFNEWLQASGCVTHTRAAS